MYKMYIHILFWLRQMIVNKCRVMYTCVCVSECVFLITHPLE